jgi:hypothetical protein
LAYQFLVELGKCVEDDCRPCVLKIAGEQKYARFIHGKVSDFNQIYLIFLNK